jgi:hypothetical protein
MLRTPILLQNLANLYLVVGDHAVDHAPSLVRHL